MYIPRRYEESDLNVIEAFVRANGFGTLVTTNGTRPQATHALMDLHRNGEVLTLTGHIARANKQWRDFAGGREALAIFSGPHTYISPRFYNHVNVPTWNYMAVHVYGVPRLIEDRDELYAVLKALVDKYEGTPGAYRMEDLPTDYVESQMQAVAGFVLDVTEISAAWKLSQNREQEDYDNIIAELRKRGDENSAAVAAEMAARRARLFDREA
ncbi:MAG: FMN-binding negative transcriptional regulator [Chloroflexi bacterium]|nr:FMN-binding negative transcriptional regulator [Chloroflexota bacterium]